MVEGTVKRRQVMGIKLNANICTYFLSNLFCFIHIFSTQQVTVLKRAVFIWFLKQICPNFPRRFSFPFLGLNYLLVGLPSHKNKANPTISLSLNGFFFNLKPNILQQISQTKTIECMVVCKLLCHRSRTERGTTKGITKNEKQVATEARSNDSTVLTCSIKEQLKI